MLGFYRTVIAGLCVLAMLGCLSDSHEPENGVIISTREAIEVRNLHEANENSIVIQAMHYPGLSLAELLVCIPRPVHAPSELIASFIFAFYEDEKIVFTKSIPSEIEDDQFETIFLNISPELMSDLKIEMLYKNVDNLENVAGVRTMFAIDFRNLATDLLMETVESTSEANHLDPIPELSCTGS